MFVTDIGGWICLFSGSSLLSFVRLIVFTVLSLAGFWCKLKNFIRARRLRRSLISIKRNFRFCYIIISWPQWFFPQYIAIKRKCRKTTITMELFDLVTSRFSPGFLDHTNQIVVMAWMMKVCYLHHVLFRNASFNKRLHVVPFPPPKGISKSRFHAGFFHKSRPEIAWNSCSRLVNPTTPDIRLVYHAITQCFSNNSRFHA